MAVQLPAVAQDTPVAWASLAPAPIATSCARPQGPARSSATNAWLAPPASAYVPATGQEPPPGPETAAALPSPLVRPGPAGGGAEGDGGRGFAEGRPGRGAVPRRWARHQVGLGAALGQRGDARYLAHAAPGAVLLLGDERLTGPRGAAERPDDRAVARR